MLIGKSLLSSYKFDVRLEAEDNEINLIYIKSILIQTNVKNLYKISPCVFYILKNKLK